MQDRISRRSFVRRTAIGAAGAGLGLGAGATVFGQDAPPPVKIERKGDMVYRRLGRTELMVSELSVGGSPSPDPAIFSEALDRGINLMDSSFMYGNGEEVIGEVAEGRRDEVVICTKCGPYKAEDPKTAIIEACDKALGRLNTDHIDIWCLHGCGDPDFFLSEGVQAAYEQLRQDGKIRFTGISTHNPTSTAPPLIESGKLDVLLLPFNMFAGNTVKREDVKAGKVYENWLEDSGLAGVLALARLHDIGVVAMKTMAGGASQNVEAYQTGETTLAQAKIKWVLSHEAVASALSEVLTYEILEENLGVVGQTLEAGEQAMLLDHVREMSASVCRMCGACQVACPRNVPIPDVLRSVTYHDVHGKPAQARATYREVAAGHLTAGCGDCTLCAQACPHGLDIPGRLRRAERVFT